MYVVSILLLVFCHFYWQVNMSINLVASMSLLECKNWCQKRLTHTWFFFLQVWNQVR